MAYDRLDDQLVALLVNAGATVMPQPFDLVLYLQFLTLEFHDSKVIDRGVGQAFVNFLFERLMLFLQFR
jgi:hypothetical protein